MHNPAYPDTDKTIGIDFDGVIHNDNEGYGDGTIYGEPIEGVFNGLAHLKNAGYRIVIFTTKARKDRPLVNGKAGITLINDWLLAQGMIGFIDEVTAIKPPAKYYIDDKAIKFKNWNQTLEEVL